MNIKPRMIYVEYDHSIERPHNGLLPVKNIKKEAEIPFNAIEEYWFTHNYYRATVSENDSQRFFQVGVELEGEKLSGVEIYFSSYEEDKLIQVPLRYNKMNNIWYESLFFNNNKNQYGEFNIHKDSGYSGFNQSGQLDIHVVKGDETLYTEKLVYYPSGIDKHDYNLMINDLFQIREDLIRDKDANVKIGTEYKKLSEQLHNTLDQLEGPLKLMSNNPATRLGFKWEQAKLNKGEKYRTKTLIEQKMNPGKDKYSVFKGSDHVDLIEHKMIKNQLISLKELLEFYGGTPELNQLNESRYKSEIEAVIGKLDKRFQEKLDEGNLSLEHYERMLRKVEDKIQMNDKERHQEFSEKHQQLICIDSQNILKNTILVEVKFTVHSDTSTATFKLENNTLCSEVINQYIEKEWSMRINCYSFQQNDSMIPVIPSRRSQTLFINNYSRSIKDQLYIFEAFKEIKDRVAKNKKVDVRIRGYARKNNNQDFDVIGEEVAGKNYKRYEFNMEKINCILINEEEFERSENTRMYEKIAKQLIKTPINEENNLEKTVLTRIIELKQNKKDYLIRTNSYYKLGKKIDKLLSLPLFQKIDADRKITLSPTQLFLHDPLYLLVWNNINSIQKEVSVSLVPKNIQRQFGVQKVHQIFEIWVLYKIIHILNIEMGWILKDKDGVVQSIKNLFIQSKNSDLKKFEIELVLREWKLVINYEPKISVKRDNKNSNSIYLNPDYVFRFYKNSKFIGIAYLDAKHRNYFDQGEEEWLKDIVETSVEKYGKIQPKNDKWISRILGSFIVHSDTTFGLAKEKDGEIYNILYNKKFDEKDFKNNSGHKYGSIHMLPSITHTFKNWFRMIMEYRLKEVGYCWTCGSNHVEKETIMLGSGFSKYYHTCNHCGEFWVKSHCSKRGKNHTLIKHFNNYHKTVEDKRWYLVCPICGDGESNIYNE